MKISKKQEQILRKEFRKLKSRIKVQDCANFWFIQNNCPNLIKSLKNRWVYDENNLLDDVRTESINNLLHDLRNGYE